MIKLISLMIIIIPLLSLLSCDNDKEEHSCILTEPAIVVERICHPSQNIDSSVTIVRYVVVFECRQGRLSREDEGEDSCAHHLYERLCYGQAVTLLYEEVYDLFSGQRRLRECRVIDAF